MSSKSKPQRTADHSALYNRGLVVREDHIEKSAVCAVRCDGQQRATAHEDHLGFVSGPIGMLPANAMGTPLKSKRTSTARVRKHRSLKAALRAARDSEMSIMGNPAMISEWLIEVGELDPLKAESPQAIEHALSARLRKLAA